MAAKKRPIEWHSGYGCLVDAGSKSMSCAAKKLGTTVADVRSCVRTQRMIDSANR